MIILNRHSIKAVFNEKGKDGKNRYYRKPIIAWDEEGYPLIVGTSCLVRADNHPNFVQIEDELEGCVVGTISGGGYKARYKQDDGSFNETPILAWIIKDNEATPLTVDSDGIFSEATRFDNFDSIVHPQIVESRNAEETMP